jgi:hypothetical protein
MTSQPEGPLPRAETRRQVVSAMKRDLALLRGWLKQYHAVQGLKAKGPTPGRRI